MGTGMVKGFDLQGRENCRGLMAMAITTRELLNMEPRLPHGTVARHVRPNP